MDFVNWRHEYPFLATFLPQIAAKKSLPLHDLLKTDGVKISLFLKSFNWKLCRQLQPVFWQG